MKTPTQIQKEGVLEEKLSFATCLMQLKVSYATKKRRMQLIFSCMRHV
jgi:hypothetical protein